MATEQQFRTPQVLQMTGVTYRQLDYWRRCGFLGDVKASGSGHAWSADEATVTRIRNLGRLVRTGIDPKDAVDILDQAVPSLSGLEWQGDGVKIVIEG